MVLDPGSLSASCLHSDQRGGGSQGREAERTQRGPASLGIRTWAPVPLQPRNALPGICRALGLFASAPFGLRGETTRDPLEPAAPPPQMRALGTQGQGVRAGSRAGEGGGLGWDWGAGALASTGESPKSAMLGGKGSACCFQRQREHDIGATGPWGH